MYALVSYRKNDPSTAQIVDTSMDLAELMMRYRTNICSCIPPMTSWIHPKQKVDTIYAIVQMALSVAISPDAPINNRISMTSGTVTGCLYLTDGYRESLSNTTGPSTDPVIDDTSLPTQTDIEKAHRLYIGYCDTGYILMIGGKSLDEDRNLLDHVCLDSYSTYNYVSLITFRSDVEVKLYENLCEALGPDTKVFEIDDNLKIDQYQVIKDLIITIVPNLKLIRRPSGWDLIRDISHLSVEQIYQHLKNNVFVFTD